MPDEENCPYCKQPINLYEIFSDCGGREDIVTECPSCNEPVHIRTEVSYHHRLFRAEPAYPAGCLRLVPATPNLRDPSPSDDVCQRCPKYQRCWFGA